MYFDNLQKVGYFDDPQRITDVNSFITPYISAALRKQAINLIKSKIQVDVIEKMELWKSAPANFKNCRAFVWDTTLQNYWNLVTVRNFYIRLLMYYIVRVILIPRYIVFKIVRPHHS